MLTLNLRSWLKKKIRFWLPTIGGRSVFIFFFLPSSSFFLVKYISYWKIFSCNIWSCFSPPPVPPIFSTPYPSNLIFFFSLYLKKNKQKRNIIPTPTKKNSNEIQTDKRTISQKLSPPGHGACPGVLMYPVSLIGENWSSLCQQLASAGLVSQPLWVPMCIGPVASGRHFPWVI